MAETTRSGGITMLDGAALVTGAAVASVHFRELAEEMGRLNLLGWVMIVVAFGWLALTASGPFLYLVQRVAGPRDPGLIGGSLWMLLGLPWLVAGLARSAGGQLVAADDPIYGNGLFAALFAASLWTFRALLRPRSLPLTPPSWVDVIGRVLAVSWPIQLGLGFVVTK